MTTIALQDKTTEEVNDAINPLLAKLADALPKRAHATTGGNNCDGAYLRFESTTTFFKVLGSDYHPNEQVAYLNIVRISHKDQVAWRGNLLERVEVDGSIDLAADFMTHYEWALAVINNLIDS